MSGKVGRPATPAKVHYLAGNPSKKADFDLQGEFSPDIELPKAPNWVKDEARREYKRIGEELLRYRIVSALDRGVLIRTACCWARIVWLEQRIVQKNTDSRTEDGGLFFTTATGYRAQTPEYISLHREDERYMKLCNELGLTPAARARVKSAGPQLSLPGMGGNDEGRPTPASFAA